MYNGTHALGLAEQKGLLVQSLGLLGLIVREDLKVPVIVVDLSHRQYRPSTGISENVLLSKMNLSSISSMSTRSEAMGS